MIPSTMMVTRGDYVRSGGGLARESGGLGGMVNGGYITEVEVSAKACGEVEVDRVVFLKNNVRLLLR